jgi:hypothetical protein
MVCPDCGGTFFFRVSAEQYSDAGYGSAQFRSLSMTQESVYICLCGRLVENRENAGRGVEGNHPRFLAALKMALAFQNQRNSKILKVAEQSASIEELEILTARVKWLEDAVEVLAQTPVEEETEVEAGSKLELVSKQTTVTATESEQPQPKVEQVSKPARTGRPNNKGKAA